MPSFFKAGGKALQSAANYAGSSVLSLWNSMNDRAKMVFFGAIAATLVAAGYKIWWQKPDSNKIEEVAPPTGEEKQKSSTSSSSVEPKEEVVELSELPAQEQETTEEYKERFKNFKQQKTAKALEKKQKRQQEREEERKQQPLLKQQQASTVTTNQPSSTLAAIAPSVQPKPLVMPSATYPLALYNGYRQDIVLATEKDCSGNEYHLQKTSPYAHQWKVKVYTQDPKNPYIQITNSVDYEIQNLCVRSSGVGSGYELRRYTNLQKQFDEWKEKLRYNLTGGKFKNQAPKLLQINIRPKEENKGFWQWLPTTSFDADLTID